MVCGDSFFQSMVALYILCRVASFDFGRFFDLACYGLLDTFGNEFVLLPRKSESPFCALSVFRDVPAVIKSMRYDFWGKTLGIF